MSKPSYGVIVGRFQVNELHEGHHEVIKAVFDRHSRVIIFVGVSPTGMTKRHPLDFETRKRMIQASYPTAVVLPLKDTMTDEAWSLSLDEKIQDVVNYGEVTLYGSRDSFVPHYSGKYKPVEIALSKRRPESGEQIRQRLTNEVMESSDFRAGVIYGAMNNFPQVVTCVDAVIFYKDWAAGRTLHEDHAKLEYSFLLAKKPGEPGWRFAGGHAEPIYPTFEEDVNHEAMQETGVAIPAKDWVYIGSCLVPDWRYEKEESKIKTLIFVGEATSWSCRARDDVSEVRWFKASELVEGLFVKTHRPLLEIVQRYFTTKHKLEFKNARETEAQPVLAN